nr:hypothetical protein [Caballeronia calidae]
MRGDHGRFVDRGRLRLSRPEDEVASPDAFAADRADIFAVRSAERPDLLGKTGARASLRDVYRGAWGHSS